MHIHLFSISWVYLMPFLSRAHGAQNMAAIKLCEIYNSELASEDLFYLVNEILPSGLEKCRSDIVNIIAIT